MRLRQVEGAIADKSISLLSPSERSQSGLVGFSHSLDKNVGNNCSFLTEEKTCRVHDTAKPAMCRLFPYTFLYCPDGLKVGLSFASTGVLLPNSGSLLNDQEPLLQSMRHLFDSMHPELARSSLDKWDKSELVAGALLDYPDFTDFSNPYLTRLEKLIAEPAREKASKSSDSAQAVLSDMFDILCASLPSEMLSPLSRRFPQFSANVLDHFILMPLYRSYIAAGEPIREEIIILSVLA